MINPLTHITRLPLMGQWAGLLALSAAITFLLMLIGVPAALMLGPMIAAIAIETSGGAVRVAKFPVSFSRAAIGCLIARAITPDIVHAFANQWPLYLSVTMAVILASSALGWIFSRLHILPGTVAIWGLLPGAAPIMMLMAEAYGDDERLVAFMQYLRVVFVAIIAALIACFWVHATGAHHTVWFAPIAWIPFLETLGLVALGMVVGKFSRIPAGNTLVPLFVGAILAITGHLQIELPHWLLGVSYAFLGWNTGLRFTRDVLQHAAKLFPQILCSILIMIAFCGGLAFVLVLILHVDPLTAYLATSPGGIDSIAIIAASTKVDTSFIMSQQIVRVLIILLIGPPLTRFVARKFLPLRSAREN